MPQRGAQCRKWGCRVVALVCWGCVVGSGLAAEEAGLRERLAAEVLVVQQMAERIAAADPAPAWGSGLRRLTAMVQQADAVRSDPQASPGALVVGMRTARRLVVALAALESRVREAQGLAADFAALPRPDGFGRQAYDDLAAVWQEWSQRFASAETGYARALRGIYTLRRALQAYDRVRILAGSLGEAIERAAGLADATEDGFGLRYRRELRALTADLVALRDDPAAAPPGVAQRLAVADEAWDGVRSAAMLRSEALAVQAEAVVLLADDRVGFGWRYHEAMRSAVASLKDGLADPEARVAAIRERVAAVVSAHDRYRRAVGPVEETARRWLALARALAQGADTGFGRLFQRGLTRHLEALESALSDTATTIKHLDGTVAGLQAAVAGYRRIQDARPFPAVRVQRLSGLPASHRLAGTVDAERELMVGAGMDGRELVFEGMGALEVGQPYQGPVWGRDAFRDADLTRPDPVLDHGLSWRVVTGTATVQDQRLVVGLNHGEASLLASERTIAVPFALDVEIGQQYVTGAQGVVLLYRDPEHYYYLIVNRGVVRLVRRLGGDETTIGESGALSMQHHWSTARYRVAVVADDRGLHFTVRRGVWSSSPQSRAVTWSDADATARRLFSDGAIGFLQRQTGTYNVARYGEIEAWSLPHARAGLPVIDADGRMLSAGAAFTRPLRGAADLSAPSLVAHDAEGLTVACRVRIDHRGGGWRTLFEARSAADGSRPATVSVWAGLTPQHTFAVTLLDAQGDHTVGDTGVAVELGRWHHLAASWDGSTVRVFVDGVERVAYPRAAIGSIDAVRLGADRAGYRALAASVRAFHLWRQARSPAQIAAGMYQAPDGSEPGLVGYWPLDDTTGEALAGRARMPVQARVAGGRWRLWPAAAGFRMAQPVDLSQMPVAAGGRIEWDDTRTGAVVAFPGEGAVDMGALAGQRLVDPSLTVELWARFADVVHRPSRFLLRLTGRGDDGFLRIRQAGTAWRSRAELVVDCGFLEQNTRLYSRSGFQDYGLDAWVHIAVVIDGTTGVMQLYLNGVHEAEVAVPDSFSLPEPHLQIGHPGAAALHGALSEIRIWQTARDATAIRRSARTSLQGDEAGLVGYWRLDEGRGTTVYDRTAAGRHGRLTGTIWRRQVTTRVGWSSAAEDLPERWSDCLMHGPIPGMPAARDRGDHFLWLRQDIAKRHPFLPVRLPAVEVRFE